VAGAKPPTRRVPLGAQREGCSTFAAWRPDKSYK
jgi:hypothetical protein